MTRDAFDALFLKAYVGLCGYAEKHCGPDGPDIVQQVCMNILTHKSYRRIPPRYPVKWLYFKVMREIVRHRAKCHTRHKNEREGARRLYTLCE